jgi:hypothetical protein
MAASAASGENGSGSGINIGVWRSSKLLMAWRIAKAGIKNKLAAAAWQIGV